MTTSTGKNRRGEARQFTEKKKKEIEKDSSERNVQYYSSFICIVLAKQTSKDGENVGMRAILYSWWQYKWVQPFWKAVWPHFFNTKYVNTL